MFNRQTAINFYVFRFLNLLPGANFFHVTKIASNTADQDKWLHEMEVILLIWLKGNITIYCLLEKWLLYLEEYTFCFLVLSSFHSYILYHQKNILSSNYPTIPEFSTPPLPSYRWGRTIQNRIVRTDQYWPPTTITTFLGPWTNGSYACLNCIQCNSMIKETFFSHPHRGNNIGIKGFFTCQSSYVIYIINALVD